MPNRNNTENNENKTSKRYFAFTGEARIIDLGEYETLEDARDKNSQGRIIAVVGENNVLDWRRELHALLALPIAEFPHDAVTILNDDFSFEIIGDETFEVASLNDNHYWAFEGSKSLLDLYMDIVGFVGRPSIDGDIESEVKIDSTNSFLQDEYYTYSRVMAMCSDFSLESNYTGETIEVFDISDESKVIASFAQSEYKHPDAGNCAVYQCVSSLMPTLEEEIDAEIAKKIDMDLADKEYLFPIAVPLLKAFENRLQKDFPETKIRGLWADIGGSVYGLHLEFNLSGEDGSEDFYYSQRNGKIYEGLNGTPTEKIVNKLDLSSVVGEDIVNMLIEAMNKKAETSLIRQLKKDMPDILNYQGDIYTMESYDMDGKEVTYGSPEAGKRITVTTDNRQESTDDLAIEITPLDYTLNHIVYTTNKEFHESDNVAEEARAKNALRRSEARSQKPDTTSIKQGS